MTSPRWRQISALPLQAVVAQTHTPISASPSPSHSPAPPHRRLRARDIELAVRSMALSLIKLDNLLRTTLGLAAIIGRAVKCEIKLRQRNDLASCSVDFRVGGPINA